MADDLVSRILGPYLCLEAPSPLNILVLFLTQAAYMWRAFELPKFSS